MQRDQAPGGVCAIIVLYNGADYIASCIEALLKDPAITRILVLDNKSTDEGAEICARYPVELVPLRENYGFGRANNIGILWALDRGYDYVYLVNQDVYIAPDAVTALIGAHALRGAGPCVMCSVQMNGDFSAVDHNFDSYLNRQLPEEVAAAIRNGSRAPDFHQGRFYNAAAWLIPADVIETVGVFDPLFPHYREDEDYASRLQVWSIPMFLSAASRVAHDRDQGGFVKMEERPYDKQVGRIHVRQIATLKEIRHTFFTGIKSTIRFSGARLLLAIRRKDWMHAKALCVATVKTFGVVPAIRRHRAMSRETGAFIDQTRRLAEDNGLEAPR